MGVIGRNLWQQVCPLSFGFINLPADLAVILSCNVQVLTNNYALTHVRRKCSHIKNSKMLHKLLQSCLFNICRGCMYATMHDNACEKFVSGVASWHSLLEV